ncbi:MAG: hypothetical protein US42_C0010G0007 [Candidatus Magasanikbacteria bacterium GW2011_GWC2_37_14]|uniref:BioF2-like acetyltransferase domain-containing protein n=1 Tax=Candidatus Magasanikbacteria bacterium GW2011_GWC2_37_14 TaxID=1619046 RepID=A0A0G0GMH5_9BACT|nr:MAG: hypothetical protein US42_C0010G0007 [Candidatus Magasanikbacteria bacterium GW2011_GWC2_37_14]
MDKEIQFKIENNREICQELWEKFSPRVYVYDNWDFRECFNRQTNYPLNFVVGFYKEKPIGILPLEYDTDNKCYEFFGDIFMEYNRAFLAPDFLDCKAKFYEAVPLPAELQMMSEEEAPDLKCEPEILTYYLDISNMNFLDDYFRNYFNSKRRGDFLRAMKKIEALEPEVRYNNLADLDVLFDLNQKRFKEESTFTRENDKKFFRDLLKTNLDFEILSVVINGKIVAASFSIYYNGRYEYLANGADVENYPFVGTYLNLMSIKRAIEKKMTVIDFGYGEAGWKDLWHLPKKSLYCSIKK